MGHQQINNLSIRLNTGFSLLNRAKLLVWLIVLLLLILIQGCTAPKQAPVLKVNVGDNYSGIAVSAERRLVFTNAKSKENSIGVENPAICAEPSPDATQSLLSIFSLGTEKTSTAGKKSQLGITELIQTIPFQLFTRSQGVQFYRDSIFALCQMAINGWISTKKDGKEEITNKYNELLLQAISDYSKNPTNKNKKIIDKIDSYKDQLSTSPSLTYIQLIEDYQKAIHEYYKNIGTYNQKVKEHIAEINNHDKKIDQYNQLFLKVITDYSTNPTTTNEMKLQRIASLKNTLLLGSPVKKLPTIEMPPYPVLTELEYAMYKIRRDAKEIIIKEVSDPETQKKLRETYAELLLEKKKTEALLKSERAEINEAKAELLKEIFQQLDIQIGD